MFETWKEYAEHLSNNIIQDNENKDKLQKVIDKEIILYTNEEAIDDFYKEIIKTILSSDWDFTKLKNWTMSGNIYSYKKYLKGKRDMNILRATKYLSNSQIQEIIDYNEKN